MCWSGRAPARGQGNNRQSRRLYPIEPWQTGQVQAQTEWGTPEHRLAVPRALAERPGAASSRHPAVATGKVSKGGPPPTPQARGACPYRGLGQDGTDEHPPLTPRAPQCARPRAPGVRLFNPTLRQVWPRERPGAAMCVQGIDVQCVLQFTLVNAAGCALHRCTSQVIHRSELYFFDSRPPAGPPGRGQDCTVNRTVRTPRQSRR